jgi:hypothetical protein
MKNEAASQDMDIQLKLSGLFSNELDIVLML